MITERTTPSKSWVRDLFPQGSWDQRARHCFMGPQMQEHGEVGQGCLGLSRPIILWLDTSHLHAMYVGIFWRPTHTDWAAARVCRHLVLGEITGEPFFFLKSGFTHFYLNDVKYKEINDEEVQSFWAKFELNTLDMLFGVCLCTCRKINSF